MTAFVVTDCNVLPQISLGGELLAAPSAGVGVCVCLQVVVQRLTTGVLVLALRTLKHLKTGN